MATNSENRFFAKAEEYQKKLKTNELCPKNITPGIQTLET